MSRLLPAPWLADAKKNGGNKVHVCGAEGCAQPATHWLRSVRNEDLGVFCLAHGRREQCRIARAS